jgi:queuosine biosynthesis protein QueC
MTPYSVSFERATDRSPFVLSAGTHFRFDFDGFERFFQKPVPDRWLDLLRIAAAIYAVDRLARRRQRDQRRFWSRTLRLSVGVIDPAFWSQVDMHESLTQTLEFLSDDTWELKFTKDDQRPRGNLQRSMFDVSGDNLVCLYSGGLDSAAGLTNRVADDPARAIIPVTVWHQPIQRKLVRRQFALLRARYRTPIAPLIVKSALIWTPDMNARFREEPTQRSRSFLFTAAGAVVMAMAGRSETELYESGIGAINLPLMSGMVGSRTTRSAHPEFLRRMSKLVALVIERPMSFVLPFEELTKGQVLAKARHAGLEELAETTVSCAHYPLRESDAKQCGVCAACIFRRQSLAVAGLHEPAGTYKYDLFENPDASNHVPAKELDYLKAFLDQVVQLDGIRENQPFPLRIRRHLVGTGVLANGDSAEAVSRLLRTYRDEWRETVAEAQGRGISWTKLLGRRESLTEGATHAVA